MVIINLGFPKTSSTNLQTHFYPYINDVSYLGKNCKEKNSKLFIELNEFIENRRKFSNSDLSSLIQNFENYCREHKKILISQENWVGSIQKNNFTGKTEIIKHNGRLAS